jgi:murein DD-endopeptidase MepM/ murein hydrolase activator NlpD
MSDFENVNWKLPQITKLSAVEDPIKSESLQVKELARTVLANPPEWGVVITRGFHKDQRPHPLNPSKVSPHFGIDIALSAGGTEHTPVLAVDGGTVVDARPMTAKEQQDAAGKQGSGQTVKIKLASGFVTYMHLAHVSVTKGQAVRKGDQVGTVGSTGGSTGPHLHMEYTSTVAGDPEDPLIHLNDTGKNWMFPTTVISQR